MTEANERAVDRMLIATNNPLVVLGLPTYPHYEHRRMIMAGVSTRELRVRAARCPRAGASLTRQRMRVLLNAAPKRAIRSGLIT